MKMATPKKDAMVHRFLHLSDIHFGQEKDGTLVKHDHVRNALIIDVKNLPRSESLRRASSLQTTFHILERQTNTKRRQSGWRS
jgi:hypothetical protein